MTENQKKQSFQPRRLFVVVRRVTRFRPYPMVTIFDEDMLRNPVGKYRLP